MSLGLEFILHGSNGDGSGRKGTYRTLPRTLVTRDRAIRRHQQFNPGSYAKETTMVSALFPDLYEQESLRKLLKKGRGWERLLCFRVCNTGSGSLLVSRKTSAANSFRAVLGTWQPGEGKQGQDSFSSLSLSPFSMCCVVCVSLDPCSLAASDPQDTPHTAGIQAKAWSYLAISHNPLLRKRTPLVLRPSAGH
ncbi:hypothetical protein BX600DRAFT_473293 [Xylariales sp. PMI_506]|nr:hypothetical protein BX600DRAFT_473293 [Xylariales sp. PMI_506]